MSRILAIYENGILKPCLFEDAIDRKELKQLILSILNEIADDEIEKVLED